jgi:phosphate-selective porin
VAGATVLIALFLTDPGVVSAQSAVAGVSGPADEIAPVPYELNVAGRLPILLRGYIQFRDTDANNTTNPLQIRRLRFIADAELTPDVDFFVELDPTLSPNPLLDAYVQYKAETAARLRAGQFKVPFSGESLVPDERTIPIERALVVNGFSPNRDNGQQGRDIGVELLGNAGSEASSVEYQMAFLNGAGIYNVQSTRQKAAAGRVILHPFRGVSAGVDFYQGKEPPPGAAATGSTLLVKQRQDVEAGYTRGHFVAWSEYLWGRDGGIHRSGGYGMLAYKFDRHWESFLRAQDFDSNHVKRHSIVREYDAGANYYFTNLIRLQANYGEQKLASNGKLSSVVLAQLQAEF